MDTNPITKPTVTNTTPGVFSMSDTTIYKKLETVDTSRFSPTKAQLYDKYDAEIQKAVDDLTKFGEKDVNPKLIKTIMLMETGMKPTQNYLGFHGYAQTKEAYINDVNKRYNQTFTVEDMYNPYHAAKFIHYYAKTLKKSKFVNTSQDVIAAYNWGMGNYAKYKHGALAMPEETSKYIKVWNVIDSHFR